MTAHDVAARLKPGLSGALPGLAAHQRLAPRPRPGGRVWGAGRGSRTAAGLVLIYQSGAEDTAHLLLTVRSPALSHHQGQVSLPGGAVDAGETVEQAALREGWEEVGLDASAVDVLGRLTPLEIPISGYLLHPVIGVGRRPLSFQPAAREVDRILEVPLASLIDPARLRITERSRDGEPYLVPYFEVGSDAVWGATAMVLAELLWLLGEPPDPWSRWPGPVAGGTSSV